MDILQSLILSCMMEYPNDPGRMLLLYDLKAMFCCYSEVTFSAYDKYVQSKTEIAFMIEYAQSITTRG